MGQPQYKKLYNALKNDILRGHIKEGHLLPSENDLCKKFNITRPTVRQALNELVQERFIFKQRGKGSIVCEQPKGLRILSLEGVSSVIDKKLLRTKILKEPENCDWPKDFFFPQTKEEKQAGCIYLERLRSVEKNPVLWEATYLVNSGLQRFTSRILKNKSLFEVLRKEYQIEIKGGEQRISAIPCTKTVSELLDIKSKAPVLHLQRKLYTNFPDLHIYSSIYCNTNMYYLHDKF